MKAKMIVFSEVSFPFSIFLEPYLTGVTRNKLILVYLKKQKQSTHLFYFSKLAL